MIEMTRCIVVSVEPLTSPGSSRRGSDTAKHFIDRAAACQVDSELAPGCKGEMVMGIDEPRANRSPGQINHLSGVTTQRPHFLIPNRHHLSTSYGDGGGSRLVVIKG